MIVSECHGTTRPTRRTIGLAACVLLVLGATVGCTQEQRKFQIGERVALGGVVYTVHDAQWQSELDAGGLHPRTPQHRFLLVHLTVSNSGNKGATVPLLNLVDASGADHLELSDGQGVPEWLGVLRPVNPTESKVGRIVFDVPVASYLLRVTDGGEQEVEKTALVALPQVPKGGPMDSPLLNEPKTTQP